MVCRIPGPWLQVCKGVQGVENKLNVYMNVIICSQQVLSVREYAVEKYSFTKPTQGESWGMTRQYAHTTRAPALSLPTRGGGSDLQS